MSSNNIFLSISVFLNLVLLALFWATLSNTGKDSEDLKKANKDLADMKAALNEKIQQLSDVKNTLGMQSAEIGTAEDREQGTLLYQMDAAIARAEDYLSGEKSIEAAMNKMKLELDNQRIALQAKQNEYNAKVQEYNNMVQQKAAEVNEHLKARTTAEMELQKQIKEHGEEIDRKDQMIAGLRTQINDLQAELARTVSEKDAIIAERDERIARQSASLVRLRREKFEREDLSFEKADGRIVFVDTNRRVVTINLGSADGLRVGNTFSVYQKDNSGIGRRNMEDIKGKIQVTNIRGPHRADARILDPKDAVKRRSEENSDDYYARTAQYSQNILLRPIAMGDPIYSPAFTKGNVEKFSFVGFVDLDQDGNSDREQLRNLIRAAGAEIDNEIGDEGEEIVRNGITHQTRFLVIGDLGDQSKTEDAKKKAAIQKIQEQANQLREEALDAGIRVVSLTAFLDYLGYQASSSPWTKGEDFNTKLKAGAASDTSSDVLGQRSSQGNVSGLHDLSKRHMYNLNDRLGRRGTSGNVSELYRKK